MVTKLRPVRLWHLIIVALLLGTVASLWSAEVYVESYPGYEESGFPFPWKRIYGGVDVRYNYAFLAYSLAVWSSILLIIILVVFRAIGWKSTT